MVKAATLAKESTVLPGACRLQEILPLASPLLHSQPWYPRVEIQLQIQSLISCELFSRLMVLQCRGQGQRGQWWDARLLRTAQPTELVAGGSTDVTPRGLS